MGKEQAQGGGVAGRPPPGYRYRTDQAVHRFAAPLLPLTAGLAKRKLPCVSRARASAVVISGTVYTIEWATDAQGQMPAREFFDHLSLADQAKILALFGRLANHGHISNRENFKQLGSRAKGDAKSLWEFKKHQLRFIGDYRSGRRFVVAHGVRKKKDDLQPSDIDKALRIMREDDEHT